MVFGDCTYPMGRAYLTKYPAPLGAVAAHGGEHRAALFLSAPKLPSHGSSKIILYRERWWDQGCREQPGAECHGNVSAWGLGCAAGKTLFRSLSVCFSSSSDLYLKLFGLKINNPPHLLTRKHFPNWCQERYKKTKRKGIQVQHPA